MNYNERYYQVDKEACRGGKSTPMGRDGLIDGSRSPYRPKVGPAPRGQDR